MLPDRAGNAEHWEFDTLVLILLRQFKRLLADRDVVLSDTDMKGIGSAAAARSALDSTGLAARAALAEIVAESEEMLAGFGLTFAQSLATTMNDMPGWETTADFLQLANEKINAEVRISAGAALMVCLGDARYAHYLLQAVDHDLSEHNALDVDAVIARRALLFAAEVAADDPDWRDEIRAWVANTRH
jgi:hypothetical protein